MSREHANQVIAALQDKQTEGKLNDRQMAGALGISPSQWLRLKRGERVINVRLLQAAVQRFGIGGTVLSFLESKLPIRDKSAEIAQPRKAKR